MPPETTIKFVVITKNSARWFGVMLDHYRSLGVEPLVILDDASQDGTEMLLRQKGAEYVKAHADVPRVEALVRSIPLFVQSDWVVRLDDDELPAGWLCAWAAMQARRAKVTVFGFERRWIRLRLDGGLDYSNHPLIVSPQGVLDTQWRMFRPNAMQFRSDIHTPGFFVPKGRLIAPRKAFIAHFNWLVRSVGERRQQIVDYDRQQPDAGTRFGAIKAWEDVDERDHRFAPMERREFEETAAALAGTQE
jgi:glycosyltransferase involved in cell wall biosynthesis